MGGGRGNGGEFDMGDLPDEAGDVEQENNPDAGDGQPPDGGIPDAPSGFSKDDAGDMGSPPQDMESADDGGAGTFPGEQGAMQAPDEGGAGGGMGSSDDVLLKYIDDDIDSYPNIFDNAKTDASDSDMNRLIKSLKKLSGGEDIEDAVDVEEVIKYFAVHDFVLNFDSYTGSMIHNYYLYENDGQMQMIPWDYNLAFGGFVSAESAESLVNYPIDSPVSGGSMEDRPMIAWIFENEEYTELYHEYLAQFIDEYFNGGYFETMIDDVVSMISPYVEKDPTKFCSYEEFQTGVETLKEFCLLRAQSVRLQLDGEIGSTSDTQESSTLVDAGDLKISDMGTMNASERSDQNIDAAKPQDGANAGWDTNTEANENADTGQVPDPAGGSGEMQVANDMDQPPGESDMQEIHEQEKTEGSEMQNSLSAASWIWLAVSAAVLAAGLVAAAVYRRRRYKKQ
ncbi:CotH kinase family protein [Brotomerdimonas butyrica]|uniref:CotH kinase family protein n=1 Tax=Brotomerdimonas butyrica TaxID=2981721 RepID=UPI00293F75A9|nr:CotH kinase family protein [Brotomerdimonas butyrica]